MPLRISRTCLALATINSPVPFLYQTRTLTAPLRYAKWNARQSRSLQSTSTTFTTPESSLGRGEETVDDSESSENATSDSPSQTPNNDGRRSRKSYLQRRAATVSQSRPPSLRPRQKALTMTRTERKAFGDLLEQLGVEEKHDPESATGGPQKPALSDEERDEMAQISAIFDSVLEDIRKRKRRSAPSTESAGIRKPGTEVDEPASTSELGPQEQAGDLNPPELRSDDPVSIERAIQFTVQRESAKIERALRAAIDEGKGDIGIWEVCKERVFSMLRYLGDSRLPEDSGASTTSSEDERTRISHSPLEVPESVPVEAVVTVLYPKMLLVAFRLLNSHFPGSPLISQFRSTIKSHGRTSAVLGSSTGLYNELIYFYWRGCNDLPGVVSLLKEMETTGVEPDERTCGLLKAISEQRERDVKYHWKRARREDQNRSSLRDPWWDMAPNRTAVRELFGEDGWLQRLEARVEEIRNLPSSTRLLADRFNL
ncbi:uncharacterized protein CDV56_103033 [Aspergillus thermomutatus]|uniref:Mtf2-like C-terminal domain-containing protein n=1 Tax=Aspergillus thermomutatus TaxID=41047 RepID=A0A397G7X1_ASPTH|nr:uncharacterized protein CDV56_103033 [Aspergillus thermomutatus]RHZ44190.1 hypothetical protein CDV56_103033 [Aspergillus thermomutatus]